MLHCACCQSSSCMRGLMLLFKQINSEPAAAEATRDMPQECKPKTGKHLSIICLLDRDWSVHGRHVCQHLKWLNCHLVRVYGCGNTFDPWYTRHTGILAECGLRYQCCSIKSSRVREVQVGWSPRYQSQHQSLQVGVLENSEGCLLEHHAACPKPSSVLDFKFLVCLLACVPAAMLNSYWCSGDVCKLMFCPCLRSHLCLLPALMVS